LFLNGAEVEILRNDGDYLLVKYDGFAGIFVTEKVSVVQQARNRFSSRFNSSKPFQPSSSSNQLAQQQINRMTYLEHKYGKSVAAGYIQVRYGRA
jgi:hypothetical protein